ncbi:hypothetical protein AVEN_213513-1, partial [Araneus ventricosus]
MRRNRKERVLEGSKKEYWRGKRKSTGGVKERVLEGSKKGIGGVKERVLEGSTESTKKLQTPFSIILICGLAKTFERSPNIKQDLNSTDQSECGSEKSLAYIEISKKLVSDVRENFPT